MNSYIFVVNKVKNHQQVFISCLPAQTFYDCNAIYALCNNIFLLAKSVIQVKLELKLPLLLT